MLDFLTVGHITLDRIVRPEKRTIWVLGGPAVHTSLTVSSLGCKPYVLSKVGPDFGKNRRGWLRRMGVGTKLLKAVPAPTTRFEIRYRRQSRRLRLMSRCEDIRLCDLSADVRIRSLHIGPVIGEVPEAVASFLANRSDVTSLDPQGYLRRVASDGRVLNKPWLGRTLLGSVEVLKGSYDELRMMLGAVCLRSMLKKLRRLGPSVCILTRGGKGSILLCDEGIFRVPAFKPQIIVDPTGAGDAFCGAFLRCYALSEDPVWSACVGSAAASIKVETSGPCFIRDRSLLMERANAVLSNLQAL